MLLGDFRNGGFLAGGASSLQDPAEASDGTWNLNSDQQLGTGTQLLLANGAITDPSIYFYEETRDVNGLNYELSSRETQIISGNVARLGVFGTTCNSRVSFIPDANPRTLGSASYPWSELHATDITVASGGQLLVDDGIQSAPGIAYADDPDTGLWRGSGRMMAVANGNICFQFYEGGNHSWVKLDVTTSVAIGDADEGTTARSNGLLKSTDLLVGNTDVAGSDLTIRPGIGSGAGDVGTLIFQTPRVEASGTTLQTPTTILEMDEDKLKLAAGCDIQFDDGVSMQAIGEMYQAYNAAPSTENFGTSYSKMTGFDTDGVSLGTTVDSTTNNRITVTNAGRYYIDVFMSVDDNTGAGATWDFAVYYGDSGSPAASTTLQIRRTISADGVINFGGILDLTAGQVVELWLKNGTGTRALEIHSAKLGVYAWGETP